MNICRKTLSLNMEKGLSNNCSVIADYISQHANSWSSKFRNGVRNKILLNSFLTAIPRPTIVDRIRQHNQRREY